MMQAQHFTNLGEEGQGLVRLWNSLPVFCAVTKWEKVTGTKLSDTAVARLVKHAATDAGLDGEKFPSHSLRRGLLTAGAARRADAPVAPPLGTERARPSTATTSFVYASAWSRIGPNNGHDEIDCLADQGAHRGLTHLSDHLLDLGGLMPSQ
jgi:hypothetical protein